MRITPMILIAALGACTDQVGPTSPRINAGSSAVAFAKSAGTGLGKVRLRITVSDYAPGGAAYAIQSDGRGDYVDGSQSVLAFISTAGVLQFDTFYGNGARSAVRSLRWNFNDPVDPNNAYRPTPSTSYTYHWAMKSTPIPLQNLGINGNPSSVCTTLGGSFSNGTTTWRFNFHTGFEDNAQSPTAYLVVTRTSISPAVWTMTPVGSCSPNSNVGALRSDDGSFLYGHYYWPFFFTMRQL